MSKKWHTSYQNCWAASNSWLQKNENCQGTVKNDDFNNDRKGRMNQRFSLWPNFWFLTFVPSTTFYLHTPFSLLKKKNKQIKQSHKWGPWMKHWAFQPQHTSSFYAHVDSPLYRPEHLVDMLYINTHRFPTLLCVRTMTSLHEFNEGKKKNQKQKNTLDESSNFINYILRNKIISG